MEAEGDSSRGCSSQDCGQVRFSQHSALRGALRAGRAAAVLASYEMKRVGSRKAFFKLQHFNGRAFYPYFGCNESELPFWLAILVSAHAGLRRRHGPCTALR
jgi:hypothetical protein